jgi:hypothetical protein
MAPLDYLNDVLFECSLEDVDVAAFIKATSIIGGCDAVEEFLACDIWPLSDSCGFEVETKETPLSRFVVRMLKVTPSIGEKETKSAFEMRVMNVANMLVGKYNVVECNTYTRLWYGQLNRVFELAGVLCQPRPEPILRKRKAAGTTLAPAPALALVPQKAGQKRRREKGSSRSGDQTSAQELVMAKQLSWGAWDLVSQRASARKVKISGGKAPSTSAGVGCVSKAPKALDLFGSGLFASDDEATASAPR